MSKAKPFVKWVGGKGKLIEQLTPLLPADFCEQESITYIEPFVGGGAMLFHILQTCPNIKRVIINDINADLTTCYRTIKDNPTQLIASLSEIQSHYYSLANEPARKEFFLQCRARYNTKALDNIENTTLFVFLNHTCFNGLYRVNKSGKFNVPFGRYASPTICDSDTILADSKILQKAEIMTGDFAQTFKGIRGYTFFYIDPPYRPLSDTSNFTNYSKEAFNDEAQIRLKQFCDRLQAANAKFLLSNSDGLSKNGTDRFFDDLYTDYHIHRVWASRSVNADATKRGKLTEIAVGNYSNVYVE